MAEFKIEMYEAPNAIEIINEQRRQAYEEKRQNNLLQTAEGSNIFG